MVSLDEQTDWNDVAANLTRLYGEANPSAAPASDSLKERVRHPRAALTANDVRALLTEPADISLRVDFATAQGAATGVSVVSLSPELSAVKSAVTATNNVISLDLGADYLEFSAAGPPDGSAAEISLSQVAIGAAVDGDPLLRTVDRDQDGRLTSRERKALTEYVTRLDVNRDGQLSAREIPVPIRLAITLGPRVHQLLARSTLAARTVAPREVPTAPDWFTSSDLNKDGDLSRNEFIGTSDVFQRLDTDNDGRISVAEALKAGGGE